MLAVFLFLIVNLFRIEIVLGKRFKGLSDSNCVRLLPQQGSRGNILDCRGELLVGSQLYYDAAILPDSKDFTEKSWDETSRILGISKERLKESFRNNFYANFAPVVIARDIGLKSAIALEERKNLLPGLVIQPRPDRKYVHPGLASHMVGYLNEIDRWRLTRLEDYGYKTRDIVGFGGLEERYDYYLRQEEGGLSVEVDHRGRFVRALGFKQPVNGKDIGLTIDLRIQKIAEAALNGSTGCVIVMDPDTGEIKAMASFPDFNPDVFLDGSPAAIRQIFADSRAPLINRAIGASYPAGSLFKIIVAAAGLETGKITAHTSFICSGGMRVGSKQFACWHTHGSQDLIRGIAHSCNVFFYNAGLLTGAQAIHDYAIKFGLGRPTNIDLPREEGGFIPGPLWKKVYRLRSWYDGDTANLSIGQGEVLVTPIQMARMMAVVANNGYLVTPYVVKSINNSDISGYQRRAAKIAFKKGTLEDIKTGLSEVVSLPDGTAHNLAGVGVTVAGKTGTAQAPPGFPHGWFAGFFPVNKPEFVICVFLEGGRAGYYASTMAKEIIEKMYQEGLVR